MHLKMYVATILAWNVETNRTNRQSLDVKYVKSTKSQTPKSL